MGRRLTRIKTFLSEPVDLASGNAEREMGPAAYEVRHLAQSVKAILQMGIGITTVVVVTVQLSTHWLLRNPRGPMITLVFKSVALGLSVAAAIELAYTLFTPGPDEAIDPLLLGLSSATLFFVADPSQGSLTLSRAVVISLLVLAIAGLFALRHFSSRSTEDHRRVSQALEDESRSSTTNLPCFPTSLTLSHRALFLSNKSYIGIRPSVCTRQRPGMEGHLLEASTQDLDLIPTV
jgi:hypothetical protein